jgi:integral membrane protein
MTALGPFTARWFRWLARAEGVTTLILFGVAMPLKYLFHDPRFIPLAGWLHGIFFMAFVLGLARVHFEAGWGLQRSAGWLVASLVPGGTFWAERRWLVEGDHLER